MYTSTSAPLSVPPPPLLQGRVDPERTTANAYVVFAAPETVESALSANMHEVRTLTGLHASISRGVLMYAGRERFTEPARVRGVR